MDVLKFKNSIFLKVLVSLIILIIIGSCFILPVSAQTDILSFNFWSRFVNRISFQTHSGDYVRVHVYDNTVTSGNGFTSITNAQPLNDDLNYPHFSALSLYTPSQSLIPQFYIKPEYSGKKYTMHVCISCASDQGNSSIINSIDVYSCPTLLYTSSDSSNFIRGQVSNLNISYINTYTFQLDYDVSFSIASPTFIYGFYFEAYGLFDYNVNGEVLSYYSFNVEYVLSDLVFSNDLTKEEIQNIINGSTSQIIENDNKNSEDIQNSIQDGADQISNTIRKENEKEKQEAEDSDKLAGELTEAIGDPSSSISDSIQTLSSAFVYNGGDCVFTWPEFKLPDINVSGVNLGGLTVWQSQQLDVAQVVEETIPSVLLTVVRSLFTIIMAVFCVVEIMDIILGVLTAFNVKVKS